MEQLKVKDLAKWIVETADKLGTKEVSQIPVYVGNGEELNGTHKALNIAFNGKELLIW